MKELARLTRSVAEALEAGGAAEIEWLERLQWPASGTDLETRLGALLGADLSRRMRELGPRRGNPRRFALERLVRRFRDLAAHLTELCEALEEVRQHESNLSTMPSRELIDDHRDASETDVDLHRLERIHLERARIRAQIQLQQIEAIVEGRDPRERAQELRTEANRLELERLLLIRDAGEPRRGLDIEIEAARADLQGDEARGKRLRAEAQRSYQQSVRLRSYGEVAALRPIAERCVTGLPPDRPALSSRHAAELGLLERWARHRVVFVAGSTHPGDEVAVGRALLRGRSGDRPLLFVVVPRDPMRGLRVAWELSTTFARVRLLRDARSLVPLLRRLRSSEPPDAVVVNTTGLLRSVYGLADGAFVGGGMHAVRDHNFCEPLAHGVPTYVTPYRSAHRERWELVRSRSPELVEEVTAETLEPMAHDFFARARSGESRRERLDRARAFLDIAREAEREALLALGELGHERIAWLRRIEREGVPAWEACPHRRELIELGLLLPGYTKVLDRLAHGAAVRLGLRRAEPARMTGAARYLLDQLESR